MISEDLKLSLYADGCEVRQNEFLKYYTSFRIGGPVPYILFPKTLSSFVNALSELVRREIPFKIIGQGTNLIVSDEPLKFVVLSTKYINKMNFEEKNNIDLIVEAQSGASLSALSFLLSEDGYSGLEFACGIPGSVGGGVYMNAGAYGGEMKDIVLETTVYDLRDGKVKTLNKGDLEFGYRTSILQEGSFILLSTKFLLKKDELKRIKSKLIDFSTRRWEKQPIDLPSAGSIFKRPKPDFFVGTTIENLGLKGFSIGEAQISTKHAGFIINKGNATFKDVILLIEYVKRIVKDKYNVDLQVEPEIWK
ncbi:UDP-N-acetylmuramate dehydrogenase [Petrotoga sibirica]|uniref:UDP-N-acetylenolpyruvoylglucosamine reductase n=2 Tax=Petrotoga sibirica TaxID=156202 RepID=A0A4V3GR33_9BACT|nr:UDP-N-acetylmuramate dehydrogenase [Petrotoga sibirica]POZ88814.1 UDP-N-acetylenolpyruvoylglucosamine reductase [Petrotoga sibirica DSM 13575]TDX17433.1 UDP-N-acetylmuramate dehydrogenase [Petrotoga sibirica]